MAPGHIIVNFAGGCARTPDDERSLITFNLYTYAHSVEAYRESEDLAARMGEALGRSLTHHLRDLPVSDESLPQPSLWSWAPAKSSSKP